MHAASESLAVESNPILNISIFAIFVVSTLAIVIVVSRRGQRRAGDFYDGGASFSGRANGMAIAGDIIGSW